MREVKNETCDLKEMVCNLKVETVGPVSRFSTK